MSALENVEYSLTKINGMLEQDYMTAPVRQILTECQSSLEEAKAELGG